MSVDPPGLGSSGINRELRCPVKYDQSHWRWTRRRFCSCGRERMCIELDGMTIPKRSRVVLLLAAANRDSVQFAVASLPLC